MSENLLLEAALSYARRGWKVIQLHNLTDDGQCSCDAWRAEKGYPPCRTPGKHPRFLDWAESAAIDEKRIRALWKAEPRANVGVLTGPDSAGVVLDTDPRNGGDWSRAELRAKYGDVGECGDCTTGSRGRHEHFAWPAGIETTQAKVEIADGLELLLYHANCVMPPSYAHPHGCEYFWDVEPPAELPPMPAWLVEILRAKLQPPDAEKPREAGGGWPDTQVGPILQGCAWLASTVENAASLTEPEWYAQLSIVGRCVNGEAIAHEWSSAYPKYSQRETAAKLQHALRDAGPAKCAKIRHSLGGDRFCSDCPSWGAIKSPIVLGMPKAASRPPSPPPPADEDAPPAEGADRVVAGETFTLMQLVERLIAAHPEPKDAAPVFGLVADLAAASAEDREHAVARLRGHFKQLGVRGLNKAIAEKRLKAMRVQVMRSGDERPPWQSLLLRAQNGAPRGNLANAITALRHAPEWDGVLWFDEFRHTTWARKEPKIIELPAGKWENLHDTRTAAWLQHHDIEISREITGQAVESVAYERRFHPIREYLKGLEWDGMPRIDRWLRVLCGATDPALQRYLSEVGRRWLISAVARVMRPGSKVDCALVFEGEQGIKKSSMLKALFGEEWFTDQLAEMNSKDSSMQLDGAWGIEIAELGAMTKALVESVKGFMSRDKERYRPPYSGRLIAVPRQCVFAGTTNVQNWSLDQTGARRFWPVECGAINLEGVKKDRDQMWAEAFLEFKKEAPWWLEEGEVLQLARTEQAARYREDPWEDPVLRYIHRRELEEVEIMDLFGPDCIDRPMGQRTQADQNRIASILQRLGWKKTKPRKEGGGRRHVYVPTAAAKLAGARQQELVI